MKCACQVRIPNQEVFELYSSSFEDWFSNQFPGASHYVSFLNHLVAGELSSFIGDLRDFLLQSASSFDRKRPKKSEGFYHGFVLAMLASLGSTHVIKSNRESGLGRYDVLLIPKKGEKAILLEFKLVIREEELEVAARGALAQIQKQNYRKELEQLS